METLDNIKKAAEEIRDASQPGINTAAKVGGVLVGLAEHIGNGGGMNVPNKKKKLKWRKVCRRAIRLGATVAKGNPVRYYGTNHQICLECNKRYKIYINGEALIDRITKINGNIEYYVSIGRDKVAILVEFDDGSFTIESSVKKKICSPVGYDNPTINKSFVYIDKVMVAGDVTEIYLVREVSEYNDVSVNFDNGNKYYYVFNGNIQPKNVLFPKDLYTKGSGFGIDVCKYDNTLGKYKFKVYVERKVKLRSNNDYNGYKLRKLVRLNKNGMNSRSGRVFVIPIVKGLSFPAIELQRRYQPNGYVLLTYKV